MVHLVKAMVFSLVMYGCELDCEEGWVLKNWCFWTVVLEKTLESPFDCKEIQPVHSEGDQPWDCLEGTMLNLKLQYFGKESDTMSDWTELNWLNMKLGRTDQAKGIISKMRQKRQEKVFCSVQSLSRFWLWPYGLQQVRPSCPSPTPWACSNSCPSVMLSNHLILCRPLLLLPSIFPRIRVFFNKSVLHIRWPKY